MKKIVCIILFLILTLADSRQNVKKEPRSNSKLNKFAPTRARSDSVENLFSVYDPSFLSVVWPKISNGVHLFMNKPCWEDVGEFFRGLADNRAWAYNAVDASGRYQAGLFAGNRFWLGSKRRCLQLDDAYLAREGNNDTLDEFHDDEYLGAVLRREKHFNGGAEEWHSLLQRDDLMQRLVAADNAPPHRLAYTAVQVLLNLTKITMAESYDITLGVCLPRSCTPDDIASIINFSIMLNDNFKSNKTIPRLVKITELRQIDGHYDIKTDIGAILLICATIILLIVTVIATMAEFKLIKCRPHNNKSMSFDLQKFNNTFDTERRALDENRSHTCDVLTRKESNVVNMETLTINNMNNANINLLTVKKVMKPNAMPPSITLDVVSMERVSGSCKRCGKYKKQCNTHPRQMDNLPACPRVKSFASLTKQKRDNSLSRTLLLCFSLNYSWKRIFNTNMANKDLSMIHVLRIIATFWIIFVHVAMITSYLSENSGDINEYNYAYYILATGTLAFDTLFFVSGLFSSHHFFYLKSQYTVEELVSFGGTCGQILQFVCFVTNRAIRLLPSYAYAIFLSAVLARVSARTSPLLLPERDAHNCDVYWWRNLLYVTNIFPREEQCMQVSWYMSAETQLHMAGALTCAAAAAGGHRAATALAAAAALVATAADVSAAYTEYVPRMSSVYGAYATLVARPLARVAPYFTGVLAGWLVHRMEGRLHVSKTRASFLWVVSLSALAASLCLPRARRTWLAAWLHVLWPAALLWPALFFATKIAAVTRRLLDNSSLAALSRLSYSMLLLHGAVARALLLATDTALCSQPTCIWLYFSGTVSLTALASLALSMLVETPCCSLLRRLSDYAA